MHAYHTHCDFVHRFVPLAACLGLGMSVNSRHHVVMSFLLWSLLMAPWRMRDGLARWTRLLCSCVLRPLSEKSSLALLDFSERCLGTRLGSNVVECRYGDLMDS